MLRVATAPSSWPLRAPPALQHSGALVWHPAQVCETCWQSAGAHSGKRGWGRELQRSSLRASPVLGRGQERRGLVWGRGRCLGRHCAVQSCFPPRFGEDPGHPRGGEHSLVCPLDAWKGERAGGRAAGGLGELARSGLLDGDVGERPAASCPNQLNSFQVSCGSATLREWVASSQGAGGLWAREERSRDRIHPTGCSSDLYLRSRSVAGGAVPEKGRVSAALRSSARRPCDCRAGIPFRSQRRPVVRRQSFFLLGNLSSSPPPGAGPKAPLWTAKARWIFPATASPLCGGDGLPLRSSSSAGASRGHSPTRVPAGC